MSDEPKGPANDVQKPAKLWSYAKEFLLVYLPSLAIIIGVIVYLTEIPERKRQAELNAWQVINSAKDQRGASGRIEAIEYLYNAGVDLSYLEVYDANLIGLELPNATLQFIDFNKSNLSNSNFSFVRLNGANLSNTDLRDANLKGANLKDADLSEADLRGANLELTLNLTPDQLCAATILYQAKMDENLLANVKQQCPEKLKPPE